MTPEQQARRQLWRLLNRDKLREQRERWKAENPERYREANNAYRRRWRAKNKEARAQERRFYKLKRNGLSKFSEQRIYDRVQAVIPRALSFELRGELLSMLYEAIYSGRFPRRVTPAHAQMLIKEHNRMFTKYGPLSLDTAGFDGESLHDRVSGGLW